MSENNPGGKTPDASGEGDKQTVAYESFAKLLGEKKKLQQESAEIKSKLDEFESAKLEAEGKLKEANETLKKSLADAKLKQVELFKKVSEKGVKSQFFRKAEKLGCVDPDLAMKATDFSDLDITEDFEFDETKLDEKLNQLTKNKPHLFKKQVQLPPDYTPSNANPDGKQFKDMSLKELQEQYKKLLSKG
jgi:hypothetical protein